MKIKGYQATLGGKGSIHDLDCDDGLAYEYAHMSKLIELCN